MYPFTLHRPSTVRQAANLLAKSDDAKLLAGGQTLIPTMKQRLASPANVCATPIVVPSSRLSEYRDISEVVAGNNSAVPIGTSGMTTARDQRL